MLLHIALLLTTRTYSPPLPSPPLYLQAMQSRTTLLRNTFSHPTNSLRWMTRTPRTGPTTSSQRRTTASEGSQVLSLLLHCTALLCCLTLLCTTLYIVIFHLLQISLLRMISPLSVDLFTSIGHRTSALLHTCCPSLQQLGYRE
jgi:hypothetical protein